MRRRWSWSGCFEVLHAQLEAFQEPQPRTAQERAGQARNAIQFDPVERLFQGMTS